MAKQRIVVINDTTANIEEGLILVERVQRSEANDERIQQAFREHDARRPGFLKRTFIRLRNSILDGHNERVTSNAHFNERA